MNILVITPFYKHDRNIASVRWTNISVRLAKRHNVIVVTQPHDDMDMTMSIDKDEDNILVARINQKTAYEKFAVKHMGAATGDAWQTTSNSNNSTNNNNSSESLIRKLKNRVLFASMKQKARDYAKVIQKQVIPKDTKIDVVISSACPFIEMLFGYELKKRLNCKWICDFRDLPFIEDDCDVTHQQKKIMQSVLPLTDAITLVVSGMKVDLLRHIDIATEKLHVVTNGFSLLDKKPGYRIEDDILHVVHTGSLYGGSRRADLLFAAFRILKNAHPEYKFTLDCAGGNNSSLIETAKRFNCDEMIHDYGFIPREDALNLQAGADCLLAMIEPFSLPAKLFEYVLSEKPIIGIILGKEKKQSEGKPFINKLQLGIVVEESNLEEDSKCLAEYLLMQLKRKLSGLELKYTPSIEDVKKYDHDSLALQIENIISSLS